MRKKKKWRYNPFGWLFPEKKKYHIPLLNIKSNQSYYYGN
jgi:hypothetical protein